LAVLFFMLIGTQSFLPVDPSVEESPEAAGSRQSNFQSQLQYLSQVG